MEPMWHESERDESRADRPGRRLPRVGWLTALNGTLQASATRRALLLAALGGLLIAGLVTALPIGGGPGRLAGYIDPVPPTGAKGNDAFNRAASGNCLMWPDRMPEAANIVDCKDEHRFEVAESIDMRTFPGSEYGPSAPPPTAARIEQISQEQCESAVRRYLGAKFDPNSKFVISMLWSGDKAWRQFGERRMLCGLQLPGAGNEQLGFKGKVADVEQSKVWPDGTCLGIEPGDEPAHRHSGRLRGAARDGGHRHGQPAGQVPGGVAARTRAGRLHQGLLHQADRRLPRAGAVAQHHADADLQHAVAAQLVGR